MSALAGRSVVVTRAREQAGPLCGALAARGATPVLFPTITVRPADDPGPVDAAIARLDAYDWIVFTSANAARCFAERMALADRRGLPAGLRAAAVGAATARTLADRQLPVAAMPEEFRGARIAAALGDLGGRRVLLPRADIGREETAAALRAAGATVDDVTVYHTVPAAADPAGRRALEAGVDAVTFTSPSTVRNFVLLLGADARRLVRDSVIACIGPVTAEALREAAFPAPVQPAVYTVDALVDALAERFAAPLPVPPAGTA
jgi:uroporphyrinogen III methyltransferase/synthase